MIGIEIDAKQLKRLREATGRAKKNFSKELAAAINATAKKTRLNIGRDIRKTVNLKKDITEKQIKLAVTATAETPRAVVSLSKSNRLGLQHFGGRQDKRGVSYKVAKQGGRKRVTGAFMGPKPGQLAPKLYGGVFKRAGSTRLPIVKLYGVSPFGAYVKNDFQDVEVVFISKGLQSQIERRIKLNILRASGLVSK
jgi:hypothetical protein